MPIPNPVEGRGVTLFTPESVRIGSPFMSGDRPQTRHKISPCARWDGETNTDTSPSTGEYTGAKRGDDWEGTEKGGERERKKRKNREDRGPVRRGRCKITPHPLALNEAQQVYRREEKKGKRKKSPPPSLRPLSAKLGINRA